MGKLCIDQFMTLDGVVQSPGDPKEDTSGGFTHGGWQIPLFDEESGKIMGESGPMDALLLGRRTYETFAAFWPKAPADDPFAKMFNTMPKYVASRTLKNAAWNNSHVLGPDLAKEVAAIKARHGETHVIGSSDLAQSLLRARLVDRLNLWIYPVTLGTGKRLFGNGTVPTAYKLVRSHVLGNGSLMMAYEPVGAPKYASAHEAG